MATTWQLLAQLDLLHQLQPSSGDPDDLIWESADDEEDRAARARC
jgi:hypothetical protein